MTSPAWRRTTAPTAHCYYRKTGYPLWQRDAENNKAGVPDQTSSCVSDTSKWPANMAKYEYQTRADGFLADLFPQGVGEGAGLAVRLRQPI